MVAISAVEQSSASSASASSARNEWSDRPLSDVICLFDVDGTLSPSRKVGQVQKKSIYHTLVDCFRGNDRLVEGIEETVCHRLCGWF